jgi:hypothetical protein
MSSSRSIAAARNRRSGGDSTSSQGQISRPNRSIAGQASFSGIQQTPQQQQQQQPRRPGQAIQQQQQLKQQMYQQPPQNQVQQQSPPGINQISKLSVSDAIGLVTLRLGRLETFMYDVQAGVVGGNSNEIPDNTQLVDKSVMTSIINRLEVLEKRDTNSNNTINPTLNTAISKLEKEIKDIKELLNSHILTYSNFVNDTQAQILEINTVLDDFDNKLTVNENLLDTNYSSQENEVALEELEEGNENDDEDTENVSTNLKDAIRKELEGTSF